MNIIRSSLLIPKGLRSIIAIWIRNCGYNFDVDILKFLVLIVYFVMYMGM